MDTSKLEQLSLQEKTEALARGYYGEGLNCAESVFLAFLDAYGLDREVLGLASGFGGGIGHTRHICGAVTGAVMSLGTQKGRDPFAIEDPQERGRQLREEIYPRFAALIGEAEKHFGTVNCAELTAGFEDFGSVERKRHCREIIAYCAALAARHAAL
jgi:C_GCAxxG_C_C family probable redox protein